MTNFEQFWYSRTFFKKFLKVENRANKLTPTECENFLAGFSTFKNFLKMFWNTKIAQNLSGDLIRPTLQSEKKIFGVRKVGNSLFSAP